MTKHCSDVIAKVIAAFFPKVSVVFADKLLPSCGFL
jgi:hypothetical protein